MTENQGVDDDTTSTAADTVEDAGDVSVSGHPADGSIADTVDLLRGDWVLGQVVHILNELGESKAGISVTLNVQGTLVEGRLVGIYEYMEGQTQLLHGSLDKEGPGKELGIGLSNLFEELADDALPPEGAEIKPYGATPRHIHVADAVIDGGEIRLPFWRGRMSEVSGWSLGAREH
jgi:hypothetical protein